MRLQDDERGPASACGPASWPTCSRTCGGTSVASCWPRWARTRPPTPSRRCSQRTWNSCCGSRTRSRRRASSPPWNPTRRSMRCATSPLAVRAEVLRHIPAVTALCAAGAARLRGGRGGRHHDDHAGDGQVGGRRSRRSSTGSPRRGRTALDLDAVAVVDDDGRLLSDVSRARRSARPADLDRHPDVRAPRRRGRGDGAAPARRRANAAQTAGRGPAPLHGGRRRRRAPSSGASWPTTSSMHSVPTKGRFHFPRLLS